MKKLLLILIVISFLGCKTEYTNYYYGKENFRAFLCSWDHYIVIEDLGDSLQIWNLDKECNAGYWSNKNMTIIKESGTYGIFTLTSINDNEINLKLDRGHETVPFILKKQIKEKRAYRIINIVQMLEIDKKMEEYIQSNSKNAEKSTLYLTENNVADEMAELINPLEFFTYYRDKKKAIADSIIIKLETK